MSDSVRKSTATQRLYDELHGRITRGDLPVGSKLPSVRELASKEGVSINTAQRTLAKLSAQNLIRSAAGKASVVVARSSRVVPARHIHGQQVAVVLEVTHLGDERNAPAWGWGSMITTALGAALHKHGAQLVLTPYERDTADAVGAVRKQLEHLNEKLIGVVFFPGRAGRMRKELLRDIPAQCVTINRTESDWSYNFVSADYLGAGRRVGRYFTSMGCDRLLLLGVEMSTSISWQEMSSGVIQSYLATGMPINNVGSVVCQARGADEDEAEAYETVTEFMKNRGIPNAVLAAGDYLALGAIRAFRDAGVSVPGDVNVIGGAGVEMSRFTLPPLSVVAQPVERIGHEAANLLIEMVQQGVDRLPGRIISTPVVLRGSTRVSEELKIALQQAESEYHFYDVPT